MPEIITDTHETAEADWNPDDEPGEIAADISATTEPIGKPFEFHVQMNNFTLNEMQNLVVEAVERLRVPLARIQRA